ncbi:MAG: glutamate--tRNA ligase [Candidatus Marinimicrobia bacterium]|nr:glutamate--tRNA ligase [Candidatus Neomarinimicrobiota bacterium]
MNPRVRFAPSPTGQLHLGGARTALSNFLFAKNQGGQFLVRIEDTDLERSKQEHTDQICDSLSWLGLNWDDELVYQSSRTDVYQESLALLLDSGKAYRCFASKKELEKVREETGSYQYTGIWRNRSNSEIEKELGKGTAFTIRLRTPDTDNTRFKDIIYGEISVSNSEIDDFIVARSNGSPVYNFTNVVDDHGMGITHVIRGDDHISNTPKQLLIYQALGWDIPEFAHLPMILGQDKKRLSKRHGATGVQIYRDEGYQPDALLNYLALLGWNPGTEEEILTLEDLVKKFDLSQVQKKGAVFDQKKLNWISSQHLSMQDNRDILSQARAINSEWGMTKPDDFCLAVAELMKPRSKSLVDLMGQSGYFFHDPSGFDERDVRKTWKHDTPEIIESVISILDSISGEKAAELETSFKDYMEANNLGFAKVMKPVRLALCGNVNGPSLFEIMSLLGKETTLSRLRMALNNF